MYNVAVDNPTRLTLERPAAGAVNITPMIPELGEAARSSGVADADATRVVTNLVKLTTNGRVEVASHDAAVIVMLFKCISGKLPRTKFALRTDADDGSRGAYDFHKGGVTERDPAKPKRKGKPASKDIEHTLQHAAEPRPYTAQTRFAIGEVVEHPSFGRGLVTQLVDQKIVVQFVDAERTLVHARA